MAKKKKVEDVCFPVPRDFSLSAPAKIDDNTILKNHLFRQTLQIAYGISIPFQFTTDYDPEKPYPLATGEQTETVASLFQALGPQDAVELALAQQFIIVHLRTIASAKGGMNDRDLKMFELTHQILETMLKYRSKGANKSRSITTTTKVKSTTSTWPNKRKNPQQLRW